MSLDRGDTRRLIVTIYRKIAGVPTPVDPTTLTLTVRDPAGAATIYTYGVDPEIVRDPTPADPAFTGPIYYLDLLLDQAGAWVYEWQSTGPAQVEGDTLVVDPAPLDTADVTSPTFGRYLVDTPVTFGVEYYIGATATDPAPDSATVTILRGDGTAIVTGAAATNVGVGGFTYSITAATNDRLDDLTLIWNTASMGMLTTYAEIVGGFVFPLPLLDNSLSKGGVAGDYALRLKETARNVATDAFERECGVVFTPRYGRYTTDGTGNTDLYLPVPKVTAVRSASVDGAALGVGELADLGVYEYGNIYNPNGWACGRRNITIEYEHGWAYPPADVTRAVTLIASSILADGPFDDRGFAVTDEAGTIRLLTAGVSGAAFSIPESQSAIARYRYEIMR